MPKIGYEVAKHFEEGTLPWLHEAQRSACESLRQKYEADAERRSRKEPAHVGVAEVTPEPPPAA